MTDLEMIRGNADMVVRKVGPLSNLGESFGYNRASVEWVDGYIERLRASGQFTEEEKLQNLISVLGSFLGECVVRVHGGEWRNVDRGWGVYFTNSSAAFPFAKVSKQFASGLEGGDSILGFFDMIPEILINTAREKQG